jgi:hypothetical protein
MDRPEIDLMPREWKSDRPKPREPIFGSGAMDALGYAIGWAITFFGIYWVLHH